MELEEKSGFEAAGLEKNHNANIVQNFGTGKHGAENVTQDIFAATTREKAGHTIGYKGLPSKYEKPKITGQMGSMSGTASCDAGQSQFDAMADEFFNDGAAENDNASPTSYSDLPNTFPTDCLPDDIIKIAEAVAASRNADIAGVYASMLAVAGASLGKSCLGHFEDDKDYGALWWVLVGEPGFGRKSPTVGVIAEPLTAKEREAYKRYCCEHAKWSNTPAKERSDEPRLKSLIADNITDERFFAKCYDNNGTVLWLVDELDELIGGLGMYNKNCSKAEGVLKKMYTQQDTPRETMSGRPMLIEAPAVTILTTTQPDMLPNIMKKYTGRGDGFIDRWLFVPMEIQPHKRDAPPITDYIKELWRSYVDRLLHNQLADIYEDDEAREVRKDARDKWEENGRERLLLAKNDPVQKQMATLRPKAHYTLCRLAVVVARLRNEETVTAATMRYCVALTNYLLNQQTKTLYSVADGSFKSKTTANVVTCKYLLSLEDDNGKKKYNQSDVARIMNTSKQNVHNWLNK